ncbi:predicted protein [Sclerotinia sclerotiorum 1980 UF-70]|uniref:Uncharacterized protein n=1 Tax=Sclerotinia sclerotiorum (strain ATCC 18683 / 1980 / Ss-1) TaxID=665079 RepID=A7EEG2_SCLS1|nr:predicted protein [Sclerotinia sclerotiorum 1980 UF-70]EDO01228.1 predicted protein [Sclerotinia sclerotiorum 1980 UF-70]
MDIQDQCDDRIIANQILNSNTRPHSFLIRQIFLSDSNLTPTLIRASSPVVYSSLILNIAANCSLLTLIFNINLALLTGY